MFLGGLDAAFAFNAVGMMTPGYKNAIMLNTRSVDTVSYTHLTLPTSDLV